MDNARYHTFDVKKTCESKLHIQFRPGKEFNGWFVLDGKKVARITVPMGRKPIPLGTYKSMARQLKLTTSLFDALLACPLDKTRYESILRSQIG